MSAAHPAGLVPPPDSSLAPPVTDPERPKWVQQAYAHLGWDLMNFGMRWRLTSAEYSDILIQALHEHVRCLVRSERAADQSRTVGTGRLGGAPKPMPE